jgi:hypothetical protein
MLALHPQAAFHGVTGTKNTGVQRALEHHIDFGSWSGVCNTGSCCVALSTLYYSTLLALHRTGHQPPIISMALAAGTGLSSALCLSFSHLILSFSTLYSYLLLLDIRNRRCRGGFSATCESKSVNTNAPHQGACVRSGMGHISTIKLACASRQSAECPCLVQGQSTTADLLYSMHNRFSPIVVAYPLPSQLQRPKGVHADFRIKFPWAFSPISSSHYLVYKFHCVVLCPIAPSAEFRLLQRPRSRRCG